MIKTIIAIWGQADWGKSETIKEVFSKIQIMNPGLTVSYLNPPANDITRIFKLGSTTIGIESEGDYTNNVAKSLALFDTYNCDVILCATRTSGGTVSAVESYEKSNKYRVIWFSNLYDKPDLTIHAILNDCSARFVIDIINDVISGKI